ncbi:hypothetical protein C8R44DRAFT_851604 [Mycena epipterygia]|nr:hypothetical protein C8R44DRAFT_851604 [Mycena epipterygia]
MDCQFSFGPNRSYFCSAGSVFAWSDNSIPPALARLLLEDNKHPQAMDTPYDVAFPMEPGLYAMCWKTIAGEDWYEDGCLGPNYARLARFIKSVAATGKHTTRTVFGPGASYFSISPSGYSWQNIVPALEEDIHNCIKTRRPTTVTLGVQGSYVVLYNDGTVTFDLRGQYPLVEGLIRNTQETSQRRGVMYVALNPFVAGEYYAVYGDGSASWNFPTAWSADVTAISREIKPIPVASPVSAVSPGGTAVAQTVSVVQSMQVSPGGTAAVQVASPTAMGGTASPVGVFTSIGHSVGHSIQAVVQEVAPAPPSYVPQSRATVVSPPPVAQSPPAAAPSPPAHKVTWQEGLTMGLKAAEGLNKIINVFEGQGGGGQQQQPQQQQQQQPASGGDQNTFNFANGLIQEVVSLEQAVFNNNNNNADPNNANTWQTNC